MFGTLTFTSPCAYNLTSSMHYCLPTMPSQGLDNEGDNDDHKNNNDDSTFFQPSPSNKT